jgi:hypothetical protein
LVFWITSSELAQTSDVEQPATAIPQTMPQS